MSEEKTGRFNELSEMFETGLPLLPYKFLTQFLSEEHAYSISSVAVCCLRQMNRPFRYRRSVTFAVLGLLSHCFQISRAHQHQLCVNRLCFSGGKATLEYATDGPEDNVKKCEIDAR